MSATPEQMELEAAQAELQAAEIADREKALAEPETPAVIAPEVAEPDEPETPAEAAAPEPVPPEATPKPNREVAAIVALRKQLQQVTSQALVLQGQNQAMSQMLQQQQRAPEPVVTPEPEVDPIDEIAQQRIALAEQFDAGEMSMADLRKQDLALERQQRELEAERNKPAPVQAPQPVEDLTLEQATAKLWDDYPVLQALDTNQLKRFEALAYEEAAEEGKPIQATAMGTLDLRTRIAALAQNHYQRQPKYAAYQKPVAAPAPQPGLSAKAKALDDKLKLQASMPPDSTKLGMAGHSAGMTEAELEAKLSDPRLTDREAEKLLKSVSPALAKKLGLAAP